MKKKWLLLIFGLLLLAGCAPQDQGVRDMDYEQTKKMVVDILKTDDG
jgi:spore germination protein D